MTKTRHKNDFYQTPELLTKELLKRVVIKGNILEPCAGKSAMTKVLKQYPWDKMRYVLESDLAWEDTKSHPVDATTKEFWEWWRAHFSFYAPECSLNWVVTNPPFSKAHEILPLAFDSVETGVAFLLRSTYSEPCKNRADWLIQHADNLRYRIDINPRPRFRAEGGSDLATVTWFVWLKEWSWKEQFDIDPPFQFITDWKN